MIELPPRLAVRLRTELHRTPSSQWVPNAQALSERYRGTRDGQPLVRTALDALSYAALLMPATYAQLDGALHATLQRTPTFAPSSLLDLGSGPGTAVWAALSRFPSVQRATTIERDIHLDALAHTLHGAHDVPVLQLQQDFTASHHWPLHDLVVIGHVLNELSVNQRSDLIARAWAATAHTLIIVEPGTSAFFPMLTTIRQTLIDLGAHVIAPCTHCSRCPMVDDWCHYATKIARPDFQRLARGATLPYEEAKYSYIAVSRIPIAYSGARVLHDTTTHKGYITLEHCSSRGIMTSSVPKRQRDAYRLARDAQWGSWLADSTLFPAE
jgi:ribosomal protein RSM22 (predicted rRNA methylase)